ncbi:MAG: cell division protein FtsB [Candidatus Paceibacteria bacterium]|jgi:cell division protein FtsB
MSYQSNFRKKNNITKKMYSIPVIILLVLILVLIIRGTWGVYQRASISSDKLAVAQVNVGNLNERQEKISGKIEKLNTSTGIEEEIREKFNVVKEGEEMIVVINKNSDRDLDLNGNKGSIWSKFFPWIK